MSSRQHLERVVNSLQQALLLADHLLHRTTEANRDDLSELTLALKQAAAALDAIRREKEEL